MMRGAAFFTTSCAARCAITRAPAWSRSRRLPLPLPRPSSALLLYNRSLFSWPSSNSQPPLERLPSFSPEALARAPHLAERPSFVHTGEVIHHDAHDVRRTARGDVFHGARRQPAT